jgi:hypothetical protein
MMGDRLMCTRQLANSSHVSIVVLCAVLAHHAGVQHAMPCSKMYKTSGTVHLLNNCHLANPAAKRHSAQTNAFRS